MANPDINFLTSSVSGANVDQPMRHHRWPKRASGRRFDAEVDPVGKDTIPGGARIRIRRRATLKARTA